MGDFAFSRCSGLDGTLTLSKNLKSIASNAFYNCANLKGKLTIPSSVESIGSGAFNNNKNLASVTISEGVKSIGRYVFSDCTGLKGDLVIPDSVTELGESAFRDCSGLDGTLTLSKNLKSIASNVFYGCTGLKGKLIIPSSVESIGQEAFASNENLTSVTISEGVKSIGNFAFSGCTGLKGNLVIPDSVTELGFNAFSSCSGLDGTLTLSNNLKSIADYAFSGCANLKGKLIIPSSVESIGNYAFSGCTGLKGNLVIPDSVTELGDYAFSGCSGLDGTLTLSKNLKSIASNAFNNCTNLKGKLIIPSSVESVGYRAFYNNKSLASVTISDGVKSIGQQAFSGCTGLKGDLVIPDSVTELGDYAFYECSGLDGTLTLSKNLKRIPESAFYGCTGITGKLAVPDSVSKIENYAFSGLSKVESLVIGKEVKTIGTDSYYSKNPFYKMSGVEEIAFKSAEVPSLGYADLFYSMNKLKTIYVPAESYDAYVSAFDKYKNKAVFSTDMLQSNIKNLTACVRLSEAIKLSWSEHIDDNVKKYVIERNGTQIAETEELSYIDSNLAAGDYTYTVYGVTASGEKTAATELKTATAVPQLEKIGSYHLNNMIAETDGRVLITAKNNRNGYDLDGNEINGKLYLISDDGERTFIGESKLLTGPSSGGKLEYCVDWDVKDVAEGEYRVVFSIEDPYGASAELEGKIRVRKSNPEKIVNVNAVGDFYNINLSWSQSSEVDSTVYKIFRKAENESDFKLIKTINGRTTLTYVDSSISNDGLYSYYVVAEDSFGFVGEPSEIAVGTRAKDTEPPTVTKFSPSNGSYIYGNNVSVYVTAVDNLQVKLVKLYYSVDGENWELVDERAYSPFRFRVDTTKITDGVVKFKALAYDAQGNESKPMIYEYCVDNTGPEKVTGLEAIEVLTSKITLKWSDVSANDASHFILQKKGVDRYETVSSSVKTLGYNLSDLYPDTEYTFRVAAVDVHGNIGEYSDDLTVRTEGDKTPPVITNLGPKAGRHNNSINFTAEAKDDSAIKSITIQTSTDKVNWKDIKKSTYSSRRKAVRLNYTISLDKYDEGSIFVRAVAEDFSGNLSDISESAAYCEYIVDKTAPGKPRDFVAGGSDTRIYLSWLDSPEDDREYYQIYRATEENGPYSCIRTRYQNTDYYDTNVERDTVYYYKLRVLDTTGNLSDFSDVVSAKLAEDLTAPRINNVYPASGSVIGPEFRTVNAYAQDNSFLNSIVFEYCVNDETEFIVLKKYENIKRQYDGKTADLPIDEFKDGDKIKLRVKATDMAGLTSEYSAEYIYDVDKVAPTLSELKTSLKGNKVTISWKNSQDADVSGYKVYCVYESGYTDKIGERGYRKNATYTFYDYISEGNYQYMVEVHDKVGNFTTYYTDIIHYDRETTPGTPEKPRVNQAPTAVISGFDVMEIGVEEFFDAGYSSDDSSIVSYRWDFGDGTFSDDVKPVKKFKKTGSFTVTLTVTDDEGLSSSTSTTVTVNERTAVGTIKVKVVDENGKPVSKIPVYFNLGEDSQKKVVSDDNGTASLLMDKGDHVVGAYKDGYLPTQKTVTVLPNATRIITLIVIKQEIVTGKFEVTRMTFGEIKKAGIDVYDPANTHVYEVKVRLKYGKSEIPITYYRNDSKIINYTIKDSGGNEKRPTFTDSTGQTREIAEIKYIPIEKKEEVIAVIDIPAKASYVKEFFDVRLNVVNNASADFKLVDCSVHLNVPNGMTLMSGLSGDWSETADVELGEIVGQETKTASWVLRGDTEGKYDLSANFKGKLDVFDEPISATFKTDEPIEVFGLSSVKLKVDVNDEIKYNALYFNFGIENISPVDVNNPVLDFDGIVSNVTASAKSSAKGIDAKTGENDFDIEAAMLNARVRYKDGSEQYIPFTWNADGSVETDIDTLSPGDAIYYEYVAYNVVDYDDIAKFIDASKEVISGYAENVEVKSVHMNLFKTEDSYTKLKEAIENNTNGTDVYSYAYDLSDYTYTVSYDSKISAGKSKNVNNNFVYHDCFFEKNSLSGVNDGLAIASANLAANAYSGKKSMKNLMEELGYGSFSAYNYTSSETQYLNDYVAYSISEKDMVIGEKTYKTVAVVVRGAPDSFKELNSNFNVGNGDYHYGFKSSADKVLKSLDKYLENYDKETTKLWLTGHGRGAAVANIVAESLTKSEKYASKENIYAYTFATPLTNKKADTSLKNIINYCNKNDIASAFPFESWGFKRAGTTVSVDMLPVVKNAYKELRGMEYSDSPTLYQKYLQLGSLIPSTKEYYDKGVDLLFESVAKYIANEITISQARKAITEEIGKVSVIAGLVSLLSDFSTDLFSGAVSSAAMSAHCPEVYLAYTGTTLSNGKIVTQIKKANGDAGTTLEVNPSNALDYIVNDSNYLYVKNSDWSENMLEIGYNELKLVTLDTNSITKKEQKEIAEAILLKLITDSELSDRVDTLIDTKYVETAEKALNLLKNKAHDGGSRVEAAVNNALSSSSTLSTMASTLKSSGPEGLRNSIINELAPDVGGAAMGVLKDQISGIISDEGIAGCFFESLSDVAGMSADMLDNLVVKPVKALKSYEYAKYMEGIYRLYAHSYEAHLILDSVIDTPDKDDLVGFVTQATVVTGSPLFSSMYIADKLFGFDARDVVISAAKNLQRKLDENYNAELEMLREKVMAVIDSGVKEGLKTAISTLLGSANVYYLLFKGAVSIIDKTFKISDYFKNSDTYNMLTYISASLYLAYSTRVKAVEDRWLIKLLNNILPDRFKYKEKLINYLAEDVLYLLKALCNTRLLGEQAYKKAVEANNATLIKNDDKYDYGILQAANAKFGTSYNSIEELYDYIYGNILRARDAIFNVKKQVDVEKPKAPTVTFNYETSSTNESFDSWYEYCLSDGKWKRCSANPISVKLKTTSTVLRVRKAARRGTVAGEITTLNLFAQREFSKVVTVKYENGKYYFSNLLSDYSYQISPVSSPDENVDWSKGKSFAGSPDAAVEFEGSKYLAIRTLGNEEKGETVSKTRILTVSQKQKLAVESWGNGTVTQSSTDGLYFVGDDVRLKAEPSPGAVFRGWYVAGEFVSKDPEYILEMYDLAAITARFEGGETVQPEGIQLTFDNSSAASPRRLSKLSKAKENATRVYEGISTRLTAAVYPQNALNKSITWSSSNSNVVAVSKDGVIKFVGCGSVTVTATLENGITASYDFEVVKNRAIKIYIAEGADKTEYYEDDTLDLSGLVVMAVYEAGNTGEVSDYSVGGYDSTPGEKTITICYDGLSTGYSVKTVHKTQWVETKSPTCSENGVESEICSLCKSTFNTKSIEKTEHDFEWKVKREATKTEPGLEELTCKNCGYSSESRKLEWCDHTYTSSTVLPSCDNDGYTEHVCTKCKKSYRDDITKATGHSYESITVEPKCGKIGYTINSCKTCGEKHLTDEKAALEHEYETTFVQATCSKNGGTLHTCKLCGYSYLTDETDMIEHSYEVKDVEPTCDKEGYTIYTCTMCNDSYKTDEVAAKGHKFTVEEKNGDCTVGSYSVSTCSVCGYVEKKVIAEPGEHSFGDWLVERAADVEHEGSKYRICCKCQAKESAVIPAGDHEHVAGDWYVEQNPTCELYGIKAQKCKICSAVIASEPIDALGHDLKTKRHDATCTEDGYVQEKCTRCGYEAKKDIPKLGHLTGEWITINEASCASNGLKRKYCSRCRKAVEEDVIPVKEHNAKWITVTEATCTETGGKKLICDDCKKVIDVEWLAPLGHKYSQKVTPATCTTEGYVTFTCSVCGESYVDSVTEATGHIDANNDGKCDNCGAAIGEPVNPPTPSDPSENCSCACHKSGIAKFLFKIGLFFQKIFRHNKECKCGAQHY